MDKPEVTSFKQRKVFYCDDFARIDGNWYYVTEDFDYTKVSDNDCLVLLEAQFENFLKQDHNDGSYPFLTDPFYLFVIGDMIFVIILIIGLLMMELRCRV